MSGEAETSPDVEARWSAAPVPSAGRGDRGVSTSAADMLTRERVGATSTNEGARTPMGTAGGAGHAGTGAPSVRTTPAHENTAHENTAHENTAHANTAHANTAHATFPAPPPPPPDTRAPRRQDEDDDDRAREALGPIGILLRDPGEVARRCLEEEGLRSSTLASLGALVLGAAVFGGVVGSFRGGAQIALAATKIPLAMVAALVVCVPAFHAIAASLGRAWPLRTVVALTVAAAGRAALVLLAFAPVLWLAFDLGLGYHAAALAATGAYAIAGLAALGVIVRGLGDAKHKLTTAAAFVLVFLAAAGQTGWMLRPYLVRPQTEDAPLVRPREGGFADALYRSSRSMLGIYDRAAAATRRSSAVYGDPHSEDPYGGDSYVEAPSAPYSPAPKGAYR